MNNKILIGIIILAMVIIGAVLVCVSEDSSADGTYYDSNNNEFVVSNGTLTISKGTRGTGTTGACDMIADIVPNTETYTNVIFDSTMTDLNAMYFYNNSRVQTVTINGTITALGMQMFYNASAITTLTISGASNLTISGIYGMTSLTTVNLPTSGIVSISGFDRSPLNGLTIPEGCITADLRCANATGDIYIPSTVTSLSYSTFGKATLDESYHLFVHFACTTPPSHNNSTLFGTNTLVYVPDSAYSTYYSTWGSYRSYLYNPFVTLNMTESISITPNPSNPTRTTGTHITFTPSSIAYLLPSTITLYYDATPYYDERMLTSGEYTYNSTTGELDIPSSVVNDFQCGCAGTSKLRIVSTPVPSGVTVDSNNNMYSVNNGVLTISKSTSGTGVMPDQAVSTIVQTAYTSVVFDGITTVGSNAFANKTGVTFTWGDSITTIKSSAFSGCTGITTVPTTLVTIGAYTFSGCTGLTITSLPSSVSYIGDRAFSGCTGLTTVTIPASITHIGASCFNNCSALTTISLSGSNVADVCEFEQIGTCTALTSLTLPSSIDHAPVLNQCTSLINLYIVGTKTTTIPSSSYLSTPNTIQHIQVPASLSLIRSGSNGNTSLISYELVGTSSVAHTLNNGAFYGCTGLTTITLPSDITNIPMQSFYNCSSLAWTSLPSGIQTIGTQAFFGCTSLALTSLPSGITSIEQQSFQNCSNLALTSLPAGLTEIKMMAFQNCSNMTISELPQNLTEIGVSTFQNCNNITVNTIPIGITSISNGVFNGCTGITSMVFGSHCTNIGDSAFRDCTNLQQCTIPDGMTSIGTYSFHGCTNLNIPSLPNTILSIGQNAFYGCTHLTLSALPDHVTSIGRSAFEGCTGLTYGSIPDTITTIGYCAFKGCTNLALTSLPTSLTSIGESAFEGCSNITITSIPIGITSIPTYAFKDCTSITTLELPYALSTINYFAFYGCTNLTTIICHQATPPNTLGTFQENATLYVAPDSMDAYSGWSTFFDLRSGADFDPFIIEKAEPVPSSINPIVKTLLWLIPVLLILAGLIFVARYVKQ